MAVYRLERITMMVSEGMETIDMNLPGIGAVHGLMIKGFTPSQVLDIQLRLRNIIVMDVGSGMSEDGEMVTAGQALAMMAGMRGRGITAGQVPVWFDDGVSGGGLYIKPDDGARLIVTLDTKGIKKNRLIEVFMLQPFWVVEQGART